MQRGIYDASWNDIAWETMRERTYTRSQQIPIVRQSSSPFDQLTHTLGLRRTRMSDKRDRETTPRRSIVSWLKSDREQDTPFRRAGAGANLTDQLERPEMTQQENRREPRVHAALPVILENATGITRDVNASGVFFWTDGGPFIGGDPIRFAVQIRKPAGKMTLMCRGNVVRTEQYKPMLAVAVRITELVMELA